MVISDPLKLLMTMVVFVLGVRAVAWGDPPEAGSKVFPYPVHETILDNGLKVVSVPFDSPGLAAFWVIVRAGSRNEIEPGKSGFAHFFEHMMFRGTDRFPREKYNDVLKELGADHNAFTSDDLTAYHILAPSSALETLMDLESDRFMNLKYSEEDFKKEAGAVLGEYRKNASSPFLILHETMRDMAFTAHTYKHTTLGFLRDIENMPNQYRYSLAFFDRWYRPQNCVLLVVGDVEPKAVDDLARKSFGAWKKGDATLKVPVEPPQRQERRKKVDWPNPTLPYLQISYHAPAFSTTTVDMPALDVISQLLFSDAAPLYQKLVVEEQEVDLLFGGAADHRDPELFDILARVKRPERLGYVEKTIEAALEDLKTQPIDATRLAQVKSHLKYQYAMGLNTAGNVAASLAHYLELTGDPQSVNEVYAMYDTVTPENVQAMARKYFPARGRNVVILQHPESKAHAAPPPGGAAGGADRGAGGAGR